MSASLDIVAVGMVTAVGLDAPSSCAAMRAGIDGFRETRFTTAGGDWLIGAPVPLPRAWVGEKRMAHLAAGAMSETFDAVPQARGRTALMLCMPEEGRPGRPVRDYALLLRRIAGIMEVEAHSRSRVIAHGRPSGIVALDHARRLLAAGEAEYVMLVGVDSYLTPHAVTHYLNERRLLTADNPNGFIAGEAAAAVLCAKPGRGSFGLYGIGLARESAFIYNPQDLPLRGEGMISAYRAALQEAGAQMHQVGYRIADLVGEHYWFKQSTLAVSRVTRSVREFMDIWSPTESVGNVGAAAVPLMLAMAYTAAHKGYAGGSSVLIEASSDAGTCGTAIFGGGR
jgi:3-oxoacyl-[acyl-carrier-protein] synthase-1